jgi:hypothetical protein
LSAIITEEFACDHASPSLDLKISHAALPASTFQRSMTMWRVIGKLRAGAIEMEGIHMQQ